MADEEVGKKAAPKAGGKKKLIFIIGGAVAVILIGLGAFMFMDAGKTPQEKLAAAEKNAAEKVADEAEEGGKAHSADKTEEGEEGEAEGGHGEKKEEGGHGAKKEEGAHGGSAQEGDEENLTPLVFLLDPITTNLNESSLRRFIIVQFWIEAVDEESLINLKKNSFRLKSSIIELLNSKTRAELQSSEGMKLLRREVQSRVDQIVGKGATKEVNLNEIKYI